MFTFKFKSVCIVFIMVIAYVSGRPQGFLGALERGIERGAEYATEEFLERSGFNNGFGFNNYNGYNGYDGYNGYNGGYDNYGGFY